MKQKSKTTNAQRSLHWKMYSCENNILLLFLSLDKKVSSYKAAKEKKASKIKWTNYIISDKEIDKMKHHQSGVSSWKRTSIICLNFTHVPNIIGRPEQITTTEEPILKIQCIVIIISIKQWTLIVYEIHLWPEGLQHHSFIANGRFALSNTVYITYSLLNSGHTCTTW